MKCPRCKKVMEEKWHNTSHNPDTGNYYERTVYSCKNDDIWVTLEVPQTDAARKEIYEASK